MTDEHDAESAEGPVGVRRDTVDQPIGSLEDKPDECAPSTVDQNRKTSGTSPSLLSYRSASSGKKGVPVEDVRNVYLPLWTSCIGFTIEILFSIFGHRRVGTTPVGIVLRLVVGVPLLTGAVQAALKRRGVELGPVFPAMLKSAALMVAPTATADLCSPLLAVIPLGGTIAFAIQVIVLFTLLGAFFDLGQKDTLLCVAVVLVIGVALKAATG